MKNTTLKPKVLVAMSGGVDSSVAAALLKQKGYRVTGAFMKNFSQESWKGVILDDCPWERDFQDVKKVCRVLDIPCRSLNFEKEYTKIVIEYFFQEYQAGRTPNPDILCNKEIKFGLFLKKARALGFDYIATGHYVRLRRKTQNPKPKTQKFELFKGVDQKKDQSYFLYTLTQKQLSKTLFPLGGYTKKEVRALARKFHLPNAEKKDSQGVCFVGHIRLQDFLQERIPGKFGAIVDTKGNFIGEHPGVWYYTIGQRKGLDIGGTGPWYVAKKDIKKNIITAVNSISDRHLYAKAVFVKKIHWISEKPQLPLKCSAKIRYQQKDQGCHIYKFGIGYKIQFREPQFAPAVGQSLVCYQGSQVLGGGVIDKIFSP